MVRISHIFDIRDGRGATLSGDKWVHHFAFEVDTIDMVRARGWRGQASR